MDVRAGDYGRLSGRHPLGGLAVDLATMVWDEGRRELVPVGIVSAEPFSGDNNSQVMDRRGPRDCGARMGARRQSARR